jgi:uncharacterized protein YkwD
MKQKLLTFLAIVSLALLVDSCVKKDESPTLEDAPAVLDKDRLVNLVNSYRRSGCNCGSDYMPPTGDINWSDTLERAAKEHSDDMTVKDYFDHTGSDGSTVGTRVMKYGYQYQIVGENIAAGYPTEQAVVEGWIKSPGHCKNIMEPAFKEMGVATSGKNWTQVFAARR